MSTGVSDHQRNKGQGNSGNQPYANLTKDHHVGDHEEVDSWRNQQQQNHHQGYASSMGSDPYMSNYYGSFQYPNFGVNEGGPGPWSTNGGDMPFVGGAAYSGMPESGAGGHYNDGMFSGGNGGGFGNFGGQPGFGYGGGGGGGGGFHGNGDYNAWGPQQPRKHYDEYYRDGMYGDERGMKMIEQGMGGLGLGASEKELKDFKDMMNMQQGGGGQKKTTWASIASQPAKPQSISKKSKQPGMPPPPMIPGAWENKNGVAKTPIAAPVQVPAWERPKIPPPVQPPPQQPPPPQSMPLGNQNIPPSRGYQQQQQQQPPMSFMPPQTHQPPPPMIQSSRSQNPLPPLQVNHSNGNHPPPAPSPPGPKYPDELKMKLDYNPATFDLLAEGCRFFVIKSYSEDDIHRSIKYEIWCSTEHGNKRLDEAFREREGKGPIYLLFSVNGSGHFCGMAQMISSVDYHASSSVWSQDKWKGQFKVKWIYVKDVPNAALRHIRLENNENKPVTNSRDTQEVPLDKGKQVLKILHTYHHTTSIFDDFIHYEKRQEEEDQRKVEPPAPAPPVHNMRNDRGGGGSGRGGFHDRGGFHGNHHGMAPNHHPRDRDFGRDNPREFREHRGGGRDGYNSHPRNDHRMDNRDQYNPRDERDRDPRDRDQRDHRDRGGMSRGRPAPMRN